MTTTAFARRLALLAGSLDLCTGLGLVAVPWFTLHAMLVPTPPEGAWIYVRFIGAFVATVGASYLCALTRPVERLRVVFGVTLLFRLAIGTFTAVAISAGALPLPWLTVSVTDLGLVALQAWLLASFP